MHKNYRHIAYIDRNVWLLVHTQGINEMKLNEMMVFEASVVHIV